MERLGMVAVCSGLGLYSKLVMDVLNTTEYEGREQFVSTLLQRKEGQVVRCNSVAVHSFVGVSGCSQRLQSCICH